MAFAYQGTERSSSEILLVIVRLAATAVDGGSMGDFGGASWLEEIFRPEKAVSCSYSRLGAMRDTG